MSGQANERDTATIREFIEKVAAVLVAPKYVSTEALAALSRLEATLARAEDEATRNADRGDWLVYRHEWEALEVRASSAENALAWIKLNAESWHGAESVDTGAQRALNVIAAWARNALYHGQVPPIADDPAVRAVLGGETTT